jgi:hypothetical protein
MKHKIAWTDEKKEHVIKMLTEYLEDHYSGEHIMQSDSAQINGLELLCDIADHAEPEYQE